MITGQNNAEMIIREGRFDKLIFHVILITDEGKIQFLIAEHGDKLVRISLLNIEHRGFVAKLIKPARIPTPALLKP